MSTDPAPFFFPLALDEVVRKREKKEAGKDKGVGEHLTTVVLALAVMKNFIQNNRHSKYIYICNGRSKYKWAQNNHDREDVIILRSLCICAWLRVSYVLCMCMCVHVCAWGTKETDRGTRSPLVQPKATFPRAGRSQSHRALLTRDTCRPQAGTHHATEAKAPDQTSHPHLWTRKADTHHYNPTHCLWTHYIPCGGESRGPQQVPWGDIREERHNFRENMSLLICKVDHSDKIKK